MLTIKAKFDPPEFGWVSPKTPPTYHNNVVVLLWLKNETTYQEVIGYYEDEKWELPIDIIDDGDFEVQGWFPYPYTPHNH